MTGGEPARPSRLPLLYLAFAQLCLASAGVVMAADPASLTGFHYHPRLLAVVHLVTLGWITSTILGSLYAAAPAALRTPLAAGKADWAAAIAFAAGCHGMVSHFWLGEASGMLWSAAPVAAGLALAGGRFLGALGPAPVPWAVKLHFLLAFSNLAFAALLGIAVGFDKMLSLFSTGTSLGRVYAHAHLAAVGWATLFAMGTLHRLQPATLPAAGPARSSIRAATLLVQALLVQAGAAGLAVAFLRGGRGLEAGALVAAAGIAFFLGFLARAARGSDGLRDLGWRGSEGSLLLQALAYLALATGVGLGLAFSSDPAFDLHAVWLYGVFGLIGFLGLLMAGVARLLLDAYTAALRLRRLRLLTVAFWTAAVPLLALGFFFDALHAIRLGGAALLAAAVAMAVQTWVAWRE